MRIEKNYNTNIIRLDEMTFWDFNLKAEENLEVFKKQFRMYLEIFQVIIDNDFDKLSDQELYNLLRNVYNIYLTSTDYLIMLSKFNNKRYKCFELLPTTMTFTATETEGHGRDFSYWQQLYQVGYVAAISSDFKHPYNKTFTKEEIKKLVQDKTIVLMKEVEDKALDIKGEEYENIPTLNVDIYDNYAGLSQFVLDNYELFGKLLRKNFPRTKVLNDLRDIIMEFDFDLKDVFRHIQSDDAHYSIIAKLCQEWYNESQEKKEYENIQKKLGTMN